MKNNFFSFLFPVVLMVAVFLAEINQAQAVGAAYFPQDTTVNLDVGNLTIEGGSDADSVVTSNTSITVTISTGQKFVLLSSGRKVLTNDGGYGYSCTSAQSRLSINSSTTKTVLITPSSNTCTIEGSLAGGGGGGGTTTTTTPAPTSTPVTTASPTVSPGLTLVPVSTSKPTPASRGFIGLATVNLKDGDVISAAGSSDPDVYIVNPHGYKRLFLNPVIFGFYGHLGGFSKIKKATSVVRDTFVTSGLFRNCETNDKKVYGVETTGEDTGALHWVNTTGEQAVADDPNFFKKVFCVNTKEFNWYPKGSDYTSVNQIPDYTRKNVASTLALTPAPTVKKYKVIGTDFLNVRASANTASVILGKYPVGQVIESLNRQGLWHKIKYQNKDAWVHGDYLRTI